MRFPNPLLPPHLTHPEPYSYTYPQSTSQSHNHQTPPVIRIPRNKGFCTNSIIKLVFILTIHRTLMSLLCLILFSIFSRALTKPWTVTKSSPKTSSTSELASRAALVSATRLGCSFAWLRLATKWPAMRCGAQYASETERLTFAVMKQEFYSEVQPELLSTLSWREQHRPALTNNKFNPCFILVKINKNVDTQYVVNKSHTRSEVITYICVVFCLPSVSISMVLSKVGSQGMAGSHRLASRPARLLICWPLLSLWRILLLGLLAQTRTVLPSSTFTYLKSKKRRYYAWNSLITRDQGFCTPLECIAGDPEVSGGIYDAAQSFTIYLRDNG